MQVARWLVEQGARHLVLLGRRGLPPRETWTAAQPGEELARQVTMISQMEVAGARVDVVSADAADRDAMAALLASFGAARTPLRGLVHGGAQVRAGPEMTVPKPTIVPKSARISSSDAIVRGMCKPSNMRKAGCSRSLRTMAKTNGNTISLAT